MITALVDGQFGSCGKGLIAGYLAADFQTHVRVGAANAGHTAYVDGEKHVVQQLPVAAYANPWASCVLGAGAMISPEILLAEVETNLQWRRSRALPPLRLYIDRRAHVVLPEHKETEQQTDLAERIGSTSTVAREGIGAAQAARAMRTGYSQVGERYDRLFPNGSKMPGDDVLRADVVDTVSMLHDVQLFDGGNVLLEGTQGTGLDNVLGFYPYVTSRHTTAAGLAADVGVAPRDIGRVILVCRTFPIRVAGNSGPFWPDSREIAWSDIGVDEALERTTVTKKVRRVATFSYDQIRFAARVNGADEIALTFADYLVPELKDQSGVISAAEFDAYDYVAPMVRRIEQVTGTPVTMIGTSPQTVLLREPDIERDRPHT